MRMDMLERDLAAIMNDAAALESSANSIRIAGQSIPCEPAQPYGGISTDITGDWGDESARVIVRTADLPAHVHVGDLCFYDDQRRRITGIETNVDGLTAEIILAGVRG